MKPKTFMKMMTTVSGEEKAENMLKIFEVTGWMNKAILLLTDLYVKDKENFLSVKKIPVQSSSDGKEVQEAKYEEENK